MNVLRSIKKMKFFKKQIQGYIIKSIYLTLLITYTLVTDITVTKVCKEWLLIKVT